MYTIGYYTGWAIAIVLLFVLPLMAVFILYLRRINHQLADIRAKLSPSSSREREKSKNDNSRNAN